MKNKNIGLWLLSVLGVVTIGFLIYAQVTKLPAPNSASVINYNSGATASVEQYTNAAILQNVDETIVDLENGVKPVTKDTLDRLGYITYQQKNKTQFFTGERDANGNEVLSVYGLVVRLNALYEKNGLQKAFEDNGNGGFTVAYDLQVPSDWTQYQEEMKQRAEELVKNQNK